MRMILAIVTVWTLTLGVGLQAADKGPLAPTLEVRVKAVNDLLPVVEYIGSLAGQEEQAKQLTAVVKVFSGARGLEGIDVKKPLGLYASLTPAMIDSPIVLLVPIADEDAFLNLLSNRLSLKATKGEKDIYSVNLPGVTPTAYFRFHKGYFCGSLYNRAALETENLLDPREFLKSDDPAFFSITTHFDRLPLEVRKSFLGQLELKLADGKKQQLSKSKAERAGYDLATDVGFEGIRSILEEAKSLSMRLLVEPKKDEIVFDVQLMAKDGSSLQSCLASAARLQSHTIQAVSEKHPIFSLVSNFELGDVTRKLWVQAVDAGIEDTIANAPADGRDVIEKSLKALRPTLESGTVDLAVSFSGTPGDYAVSSAIRMKKGTELEKLIKEYAPLIPVNAVLLQTDAAKAGKTNLHKAQVLAHDVKTHFGTDTFWLATGNDLLALSSGENQTKIESIVKAKPAPGQLLRAELSLVRFLELAEKELTREEVEKLTEKIFEKTDPVGNDTVIVQVTGGDKLSIRTTVKGKGVQFAAELQKKKQK